MRLTWQQFRLRREAILRERTTSLHRFDLTDPRALFGPIGLAPPDDGDDLVEAAVVARTWSELVGLSSTNMVLGTGVRELLRSLLPRLALTQQRRSEIWLPTDAYPMYWEICSNIECLGYATLPKLDLEFLSRTKAAAILVMPVPIVTTGHWPSREDLARLCDWLKGGAERLLVCDSVYAYDMDFSRFSDLLATDQCVLVHSLAKTWLLPSVFGVALGSSRLTSLGNQAVSRTSRVALDTLLSHPNLPKVQQQLFDSAWTAVRPLLPDNSRWSRPAQGYFSTIRVNWNDLLASHDILALPATVFGRDQEGLSVLSCLAPAASLFAAKPAPSRH